ncbi:hypothetical protein KSP39_PZI013977 [Platanthera zijinensis]|uniref:WLM domain-containing protein n=1 Tax=Platanthera zijinensis TaxID=2320716 RepID=A0AAP0BCE0_9ASPA
MLANASFRVSESLASIESKRNGDETPERRAVSARGAIDVTILQGEFQKVGVLYIKRKFAKEIFQNCDKLLELEFVLRQIVSFERDEMEVVFPNVDLIIVILLGPLRLPNSSLILGLASIIADGKPIRMMGVFDDEINDVSQSNMHPDLRIAGFDEEDKRLRQLSSYRTHTSLKLPQGPYIFCDFRTLDLPGIKLNPPSLKALRIMHILACDPGIIAVMNKHRWRVGIMTEMAPVGYVGISPKCILGFNKNHGEEISLRLRTDDLKGFRKYESIKKTLLHELAHMVYSEHDVKFLSLEKQLNEEAADLDWTKSRSHSLTSRKVSNRYEDEVGDGHDALSQQFGWKQILKSVRGVDRLAAMQRVLGSSEPHFSNEPSPAPDLGLTPPDKTQEDHSNEKDVGEIPEDVDTPSRGDATPSFGVTDLGALPPKSLTREAARDLASSSVPPIKDSLYIPTPAVTRVLDQVQFPLVLGNHLHFLSALPSMGNQVHPASARAKRLAPYTVSENTRPLFMIVLVLMLANSNFVDNQVVSAAEESLDAGAFSPPPSPGMDEGFLSDLTNLAEMNRRVDGVLRKYGLMLREIHEERIISDSAMAVQKKLKGSMRAGRSDVKHSEATVLAWMVKRDIRNVIRNPKTTNYLRLNKASVGVKRKKLRLAGLIFTGRTLFAVDVYFLTAAMEVLTTVGFSEDVEVDEAGEAETYLVLKRNDPGLLWLAKSSLEIFIA